MFGFIFKTACFTFLSLVDLVFTLFHHCNNNLDEVNPVADAALQVGGPVGLCAFKTCTVAVFVTAVAIIYFKNRKRTALWVLNIGIFVMVLVAVYHVYVFYV